MKSTNLIEYGSRARVDEKDRKIIEILDMDARASIAKISTKTGIPRDSVKYRIERMEAQKVIRFYHTILNPSILGYEIYAFVNVTFSSPAPKREQAFIAYAEAHPLIVYVAKTTGKWDYTLCVVGKNLKEFNDTVSELRVQFSDLIKDYDTAVIIQEYKFDSMVGLLK